MLSEESEREILVTLNFLELSGVIICKVGNKGVCGIGCGICGVVSAGIYEHYFVCDNVRKCSLLSLLVCVRIVLNRTDNADSGALLEVL